MPHRPEGQASASLSPGGVVGNTNSSVYTPPRVTGSTAAAIMRQQTSDNRSGVISQKQTKGLQYGAHPSGVVTPVIKNKGLNWLSASNKSSDSMDRSTTTTDDSRSIATLATEDEREATASALLMVAKAAEREHQQYYLKGMVVDGGDGRPTVLPPAVSSSASTCSASTVPLKKRKKQLDILRRQQQTSDGDKDAVQISPVSHDPSSSNSSHRAQSYDSKDLGSSVASPKGEITQELLDSAKVHSTAQIGAGGSIPVSQVLIPHFPTVLHQVLESKGSPVIQWLPDGEAWKVENWNAMRKQILPKYFSNLRDENGSSCGTIDAFLHNIDAWGFEEIKTGPNAGAYHHSLFIRGAQKLCVKIRMRSDDHNKGTNKKVPKTISPGRRATGETDRMMLQVPMLATADSKKQQALPPNKRTRYENNAMGLSGHGALHWPYSNESAQGMVWGGPANGQFNPHSEISNARAFGMRTAMAMNGSNPYAVPQSAPYGMDQRMQLLRAPASDSMILQRQQQPQQPFQYNPPQVRSGRGALRGMAAATQQNRGAMVPSPSTTPSFRHGFPVSNRGKGSRKAATCRTPLVTSASTAAPSEIKEQGNDISKASDQKTQIGGISLSEAERIGNSVKGGVIVAISRKSKRKLPMAGDRKGDASSTSTSASSTSTTSPASV